MSERDGRTADAFELHAQPLLQDAACARLIEDHARMNWYTGTVGKSGDVVTSKDIDIRRCQVAVFSSNDTLARIEAMANALFPTQTNARLGFHTRDMPTILRYRPGDFFDWHVDTGRDDRVACGRVVSFSIQLSDPEEYSGGDLEFNTVLNDNQRAYLRNRGHIVIFPSRAAHRVTAITAGIRYAAVGWLHFIT